MACCRLPELVRSERPAFERIVARGDMPVAEGIERWIDHVAVPRLEARAARMEVAGARRIERARNVALEHDRLPGATALGIGDRNGRKQRSRVGMLGLLVELQLR